MADTAIRLVVKGSLILGELLVRDLSSGWTAELTILVVEEMFWWVLLFLLDLVSRLLSDVP